MTEFRRNEECMGTVFVFHGRTANAQIDQLLDKACEELHEADRIFSLYKPESPLSQLARGETSVANCPPVVEHVWDLCEQWEHATGGYFKAFTPQHTFDPSGLVKTWAAQTAIDVLLTEGVSDFTLNDDIFPGLLVKGARESFHNHVSLVRIQRSQQSCVQGGVESAPPPPRCWPVSSTSRRFMPASKLMNKLS